MKHGGVSSAIFWLVIGILLTFGASRYEIGRFAQPGPGFFPLGLGLLLVLLSVIVIVGELKKSAFDSQKYLLPISDGWKKVVYTVAILFVAAFFFEKVGYLLTFFFLVLLLMRVVGGQSWKTTLLVAFCATLGAHLIFVILLKQPLPRGLLGV